MWAVVRAVERKSKFGAFLRVFDFDGSKWSVNDSENGSENRVKRAFRIFKCEVMLKTEMWGCGKCMCGMERRRGTHPSIFLYLSAFPKILVSLPTLVKLTAFIPIYIRNLTFQKIAHFWCSTFYKSSEMPCYIEFSLPSKNCTLCFTFTPYLQHFHKLSQIPDEYCTLLRFCATFAFFRL